MCGSSDTPTPLDPTRALGVSRRDVLAGVAATGGLLLGGARSVAATPTPRVSQPSPLVVLTRNLYVGANLFRLFEATATADVPPIVADLLAAVENSDYERRLAAVADEIERERPHLVGLQEVTLLRVQSQSDHHERQTPNATVRRVDFLRTLQAELARRDLRYRVVARVTNADVEVPAADRDGDDELMDVRLTDRDVILARSDVDVRGSFGKRYGVALTVPYDDDRFVSVYRGYCAVEAALGRREFLFVTTHLETPLASAIQLSQAVELRTTLRTVPIPVVLVGDFNSEPGDESYALLAEEFRDAFARARPEAAGPTCCHTRPPTADPTLRRRIDHVFVRGDIRVVSAARVGAERVEGSTRWPSDHAGVVAELDVTPLDRIVRRQTRAGVSVVSGSLRRAASQAEAVSQALAVRLEAAGSHASGRLQPLLRRAGEVEYALVDR